MPFFVFFFHLVAVKNKDLLNDDASHFKLARSVLKVRNIWIRKPSVYLVHFHELKKIVRLVLNAKCEIVVHAVLTSVIVLTVINKDIVHLVAYIYMHMLTSNEEISKIEKIYL